MKKFILIILLIVFVPACTSSFSVEKSEDGSILTVDGVNLRKTNIKESLSVKSDAVAGEAVIGAVLTLYISDDDSKVAIVYSHTAESYPYAMLYIDNESGVKYYEDFNCDSEWNEFDTNKTKHVVPDCAKAAQ